MYRYFRHFISLSSHVYGKTIVWLKWVYGSDFKSAVVSLILLIGIFILMPSGECHRVLPIHYNDVIMGAIASQISSLTIVYSTVYSGGDQRTHQSSASLAFVRGITRWPVNSPHKWPVTRKMFNLMPPSWLNLHWFIYWQPILESILTMIYDAIWRD